MMYHSVPGWDIGSNYRIWTLKNMGTNPPIGSARPGAHALRTL